jgi:hypothetical protein
MHGSGEQPSSCPAQQQLELAHPKYIHLLGLNAATSGAFGRAYTCKAGAPHANCIALLLMQALHPCVWVPDGWAGLPGGQ